MHFIGEADVMPRLANWASACMNHTSARLVQNFGSFNETAAAFISVFMFVLSSQETLENIGPTNEVRQ